MTKPIFTGVCTALVTPFLNDQINIPLLERLLDRQMQAGVSAVVLAGTTGEAPALTNEEKLNMIVRAKSFVGKDCMIIAGTGTNSTSNAIAMSQQAAAAGADALLVVSPYYNKGNPAGLIRHYSAIASSVKIPIIVYNVPSRTGMDIPIQVYAELSKIPNIAGVKEASNDITKISKIRYACPDSFCVWSGNDDQAVPAISLGAMGVISVLSNLCPEEIVEMTQSALLGDYATAASYQSALSPLIEAMFCEVNPIPIKYAMRYAGFDCGECRTPLGPISEATKNRIETIIS